MGLYNNVPTFTYVSATGITVTYNKQVYTVQSFYTNKKYIYWDYDNATVLQASNTMPTRSFKTHLVIINDNGIATTVPSTYEGFEISYSGDSDEAIKSKIYALYEKDREHGEKFVAIEQDIDGIRQIVGSTETDEGKGTIIDRLSTIEQTASKIELKVEENQKTYNSDKEITQLREDLNTAIISLNADLSTFGGEIFEYYKDNKISNEEKVSIETMLELITTSRSEVLVYADKVKLVAQANENTSGVTSLNSAIQSLDTVHTSLINIVTTAIGDGIITPTEKTVITNAIAQYNLKINEFKNTCDDIIFLGFGGTVVEKLSQISMKSNEIKLSVSMVESNFTSDLSLQKEELKGQIEDVSNSLGTFKNTVETTFRDGLITEAEKKVLLEKIEQLEKEKLDVDARYLDAYNNKYLVSPYKENLKSQHDKFDNKHSELKSKISEVVALGNVTENETLQINTLFNEYSVILSELKVVLDNSLDIISTGKANEEILKAKEELSKEIGDINNTLENVVDNLDYLVSDGIVDTSERKAIESTLTSLEKEKTDVEAQFTYWGSNSYLVDPLRSQYDEVYETYLAKYDSLVNVIESIIYKEGLVNDTDRNNMVKADTELTNTLYDFLDKTNEVIEFVTLKQYEDLISVVEEDIKDIYGNLKDLDIVLDGTLEDSFLNEAEKIAIREQLAILDREKVEVDANHENIYNNPYLSTELKMDLKSEYDSYVSSYNYLVSTIEEIVNTDGLIPTASQIEYSNAINEYKENIGIYTIILKECVDDISNNSIDEAKEILHNEISDVIGSLEKLETDMNEVFRDGVLSDAEKTTINQQLETIKKEKGDVDKQYSALYSNASLVDTTSAKPKSELKTAYDNFVTKYNSLVSTINTIIAKTTIVDDTDRTNLSNALTNYRTASSNYIVKATNAIDAIAQNKADNSESESKRFTESQIEILNDSLTLKVTEVIQSETVNLVPNSTASNGIGSWRADSGCNIDLANNSITDRSKTRFIFFNRDGDTIFIEDVNGKNILVDGGYEDDIDYVINGLKDMGVKKLDYIIITHFHSDHCGGTPRIISEFLPSKIYIKTPDWTKMPSVETEWETRTYYNNVISACSSNGVSRVEVSEGLTLNLGKSSITFYNTNCTNYSEYNNISYGFLYKYGNTKSFFAGDMTYVSEKNIEGKIGKVDLLKLGHHGINGSTSDDFVKELQPSIGVFTSNYLDSNLHGTQDNYKKIALYGGRGYSFGNLNPNEMIFEVYNDSIITSSISSKFSEGWFNLSNDTNFYYFKTDGMLKNSWVSSSTTGIWYYLGVDGIMKVNSFINHIGDGNTYYVDEDGGMVKSKWVLYPPNVGSYYWMDANGVMVKNSWVLSANGFYYYLKSDGKMATSEKMTIDGVEYEFNANGTIKE